MKKYYEQPSLKIEKFDVEDIITTSANDLFLNKTINIETLGAIKFTEGNTLQSINYKDFLK